MKMQLQSCDKDIAAISERIPRVDFSSLQDIDFLEKGMFGHVRKVRVLGGLPSPRRDNSQDSGICSHGNRRRPLVLASKHINLHSNDPEDAASQLANEAKILSNLNHENIIKLRGVCSGSFSESFKSNPRGYFLLFDVLDETLQTRLQRWRNEKRKPPSLCSSIRKKISKRLPLLSPRIELIERCQVMHTRAQDALVIGIARGLEYLHSHQIVWRDLKPANIGYYRNTSGSWTVKLIDFGMARRVQDCLRGECCGSQAYMAPEAMRGDPSTPSVDVFAFGVVLAEICSLCVPYLKSRRKSDGMSDEERFDSIRKQVEEEGLQPMDNLQKIIHCPEIQYLIYECWSRPEYRPTCTDIVVRLDGILNPTKSKDTSCSSTKIPHDLTQISYDEDL